MRSEGDGCGVGWGRFSVKGIVVGGRFSVKGIVGQEWGVRRERGWQVGDAWGVGCGGPIDRPNETRLRYLPCLSYLRIQYVLYMSLFIGPPRVDLLDEVFFLPNNKSLCPIPSRSPIILFLPRPPIVLLIRPGHFNDSRPPPRCSLPPNPLPPNLRALFADRLTWICQWTQHLCHNANEKVRCTRAIV